MHILFSLLRIKVLYMYRALLAHLQEALHKRHLVYCVHVMSVGCTRIGVEFHSNPGSSPQILINWRKSASRWFYYTDILRCTVTILTYYDARSIYWHTKMHGHYSDRLRCTITILIYYDARSLYWYTVMHRHYTDILRCTVTILIYYDSRSLYWYTTMHGPQNTK
jgi:hypothetical protein